MNKAISDRKQLIGSLPAILSILLWCFSGVCFRKGSELLGTMTYLMFITGGGALFAVVIHLIRRKSITDILRLPGKVVISGFFGVAVYTIILAMAFGMAEPKDLGLINLLNYIWPVWMVVLSIILLHESSQPGFLFLGMIAGFIGLTISRGSEWIELPSGNLWPHFMALSGGFLWALYSVLLKKWHIPEEKGGTCFLFLLCSIMAGCLAYFRNEWTSVQTITSTTIFWILFGAVGPVGLAYYFWEIGIKRGSISFIASLAYFIPIGSSIIIGIFFYKALNKGLIPGAVLIAAGSWMVRHALRTK